MQAKIRRLIQLAVEMAQNVYDEPEFFREYAQLPRSLKGLEEDVAPEWPILRQMVGDMRGLHVLDLGCGFGWFSRWSIEAGASTAHGIDISQNMLTRARAATTDLNVKYEWADLETVNLPERKYDLAYSSLAIHYLPAVHDFFVRVARSLKSRGRFVFSIEHPIATAPSEASWKWDERGRVMWPLNQYTAEGERITDWLAKGVRKYHRMVETYLTQLLEAGFTLVAFKESRAGLHTDHERKGEGHRPYYLLVHVELP